MTYVEFDPNGRTKREKLLDQLEQLDKELRQHQADNTVKIPDSLNLTEKALDDTTNEQITQQVNKKHNPEKELGIEEITATSEEKSQAVEGKKADVISDDEAKVNAIEKEHFNARQSAEDDALRRGISSSSIYDEQLDYIDDSQVQALETQRRATQDAISALDMQIELLNQKLQRDLADFEIAHAAKVSKEIDKLIAERDRQNAAAISYNNTIKEKEAAYQEKRRQLIEQRQKEQEEKERYELEHGYTGYKKENYLKRYELAREYYKSKTRDDALEELRGDATAQKYLGYYYQKLLDEITFAKH